MNQTYKGSCFCGAVDLTVSGEPVAAGFCHCSSCRSWAAAPVNAFSLWKPDAVKVTKGEGNIGVYHKTEKSYRKFCKICGGHLFTEHPPWGVIDVYAATIPTFRPRARALRARAAVSVDLPAPGEPVRPVTRARPVRGKRCARRSGKRESPDSAHVIARATRGTLPARTPSASSSTAF